MSGRRIWTRIRLAGFLNLECGEALQVSLLRVGLIQTHVRGLDEGGLDVEDVDFIQHALDEALDGVLGSAEGSQSRHAKRATGTAENEVAATLTITEIRQRQLDDIQGAHEAGLELV